VKLVTVAEMQAAERECGVPVPQLMENAGLAFAEAVRADLGDLNRHRVLVLAGPGNNGGDGLVAARHLSEWGASVQVYLLRPRLADDAVYRAAAEKGITIVNAEEDSMLSHEMLQRSLAEADVIIDAFLGTGVSRPIEGELREIMRRLESTRARANPPRLFAVDVPSGVDPDSGAADPAAVAADMTVSFQWSKTGLHQLPGKKYGGRLEVVDIGIPAEFSPGLNTEMMTAEWARALLPPRPADAHKGTFGHVLVVAGSPRYVGAAYLATAAALRVGAGLATLACGRTVHPMVAAKLSEATFLPLPDEDGYLTGDAVVPIAEMLKQGVASLLVGPGLGQAPYVRSFLSGLLTAIKNHPPKGLVIDADGLNNLAQLKDWPGLLPAGTVLTPHPGEMARLTGLSTGEVQADRLAIARRFSRDWQATVVLKGAYTIVAAPEGCAAISPFANASLASGGTGDVLAGAVAGLLAQGMEPFAAAALGVYLHGQAAENWSAQFGEAGLLAGDLLPKLPRVINALRRTEENNE